MSATGRDVHIDRPLTNMMIAYRPEGMIADLICPIIPVQKQSDGYYVWNRADAYATSDDKRAPATETNVIYRDMSSDTYFAQNYGHKTRTPYEDIENADAGYIITERRSRGEFCKDRLMLNMEYRIVSQVTSTSNVGSSSATGSAWTDHTNSNPVSDINTGLNNIQNATGTRPNSIILGGTAWQNFRENATVIDRMYGNQTTGAGRMINVSHIKSLFDVERVLIGGAYRNTADKGQTASLSSMWGEYVLLYYAPMTPRKDKPSFMYAFRWNKIANMEARIFQDEKAHAEEVELMYYQDEKITASDLSFLITNTSSST